MATTVSAADKLEEVLRAVRDVEAKADTKLSEMKREMEAVDDRLVKKIRLDSKPTFKKRGHEMQHLFNICFFTWCFFGLTGCSVSCDFHVVLAWHAVYGVTIACKQHGLNLIVCMCVGTHKP